MTTVIYSLNASNENNQTIKEKIYETPLQSYVVLYTDSLEQEPEQEQYHSVILEYPSRRLLSFAPPKNPEYTDINDFLSFYRTQPNIYTNEFVEGTFIHLFYDIRISSWEIATKRAVGGNYSYFHIPGKESITYKQMVIEAFRESIDMSLNDLPFLDYLPKKYCYSFVLQHPANHIVIPIHIPKMYLVSIYEIDNDKNTATFVSPLEYQSWSIFDNLRDGIIYFPKMISSSGSSSEKEDYMKIIQNNVSIHTPYTQMGLMMTNLNTGKRCSIINPNYVEMCKIRGNHTNIQYQYLCLRRINKVLHFLKYFPQYKSAFYEYREQYENLLTNIHQSYISYYIQKNGVFISKKYFPIIYDIHHSIFLPSVKTSLQNGFSNKIIIKRSIIKDYVNQLDPGKILHIINTELLNYSR